MLSRRFRREEAQEQTQKTLGQDGFSAPVVGVAPRPWRNESPSWSVPAAAQNPVPQSPVPQPMPQRPVPQAAYAMVGRRVIDFADNGDGTLTAQRCMDPMADDLDIQFEAGACRLRRMPLRAALRCGA